MNIGELVLNLAVKGGGKTVSVLGGIKNSLTDLSLGGIAAKTAIAGALIGLERLTAASAKFGNRVTNQSLLTGLSATKIQQWGEYMRKSGGDAEDAASSLQAAQNILTSIKRGEGVPVGVSAISRDTHTNLLQHLDDAEFVANKVREYIRTTHDSVGVANANAESLGITRGAIAAFRKNGEDIGKISTNISSEGDIRRLDEVYQHWSNLWRVLEKLRDLLTARWGLPILQELEKGVHFLERFVDMISKIQSFKGLAQTIWGGGAETKDSKNLRKYIEGFVGKPPVGVKSNVIPLQKAVTPEGKGVKTSQVNINIEQNGIEDTHDSVDAFKNEIAKAYASISTIGTVA